MQIFLRLTSGKMYTLDVETTWTVAKLKEAIYERTGLGTNQQRLMFTSNSLENDKTLEDYNIAHECTIFLIPIVPGGHF